MLQSGKFLRIEILIHRSTVSQQNKCWQQLRHSTARRERSYSMVQSSKSPSVASRNVSEQGIRPIRKSIMKSSSAVRKATTMAKKRAVAIAFGSNMGDRIQHIESAIGHMRQHGLKVQRISCLYETKPMYYEDQGSFLNGACQIETDMQPLELLDTLQAIETKLGRKRTIDKGPRTIDLDIILYGNQIVQHERLQVPHKLLLEREFVLKPLADILPEAEIPSSGNGETKANLSVSEALARLPDRDENMSAIGVVTPELPFLRIEDSQRKTLVMAILNVTPDSFSDGGVNAVFNLQQIKETVKFYITSGASIIDIGGQSTRPNAEFLTADQELERVIPVIKALRSMPEADNVALSIDTFHAKVAKESVRAGVDIINDVSAGLLDEKMLPTAAASGKTIILMHMRGTPHTMTKLTDYPYGVINGVASELRDRIEAAKSAGIPPWRIILDPGIGFAKNQEQNLDLLANFGDLRRPSNKMVEHARLPWLVGTSRKGFIGKITHVQEASKRGWGTAAAVTASIAGGADIVRVHDVAEMAQVVKMADAIYRR